MTIWYVDCYDLSCAWTKKEDAIKYFENEAKGCEWVYKYEDIEALSLDNENFIVAHIQGNEDYEDFTVTIEPIFLDEKPYWDVKEK